MRGVAAPAEDWDPLLPRAPPAVAAKPESLSLSDTDPGAQTWKRPPGTNSTACTLIRYNAHDRRETELVHIHFDSFSFVFGVMGVLNSFSAYFALVSFCFWFSS